MQRPMTPHGRLGDRDGHLLDGESPQLRPAEMGSFARRLGSAASVNLEKSIQLLDEAVGTPGGNKGILRTNNNNSRTHNTSHTPYSTCPSRRFDTTSYSVMSTPGSKRPVFGETTMNLAMTPGLYNKTQTTFMDDDVTTTNVALLLEEDPGISASTALFGDFMECMKRNDSEHQVFRLLDEFEQTCSDQVMLLWKLASRITAGSTKLERVWRMIDLLKQEKHTWSLLYSLYKDRLESDDDDIQIEMQEESMIIDSLNKGLSEKQIVANLYKTDTSVRQAQLVIDWLEKSVDDYYDKVEFFTDQTGAWEHTLHALEQKKAGILKNSDRPLVSSMDPDAPIREKRPLSDLDQEDESRLLKLILFCIRAGKLEEAQRMCVRCGQAWRAATLEGWRLHHDPNYESELEQTDMNVMHPIEGNPYRDVWKTVCWRMAEDEKLACVERSIYAALSGNLTQLLTSCASWEDQVWAYVRTMVDQRVEQEIHVHTSSDRGLEELPSSYWSKTLSMELIFREIQSSPDDNIRAQSKQRYNIIQKYIILADTDALIEEMYEWCKDDISIPPKHLRRFMAHLVLFFRTIGVNTKEDLCVTILESYVKSLVDDRQLTLVATYVATLPQNLQVEWYAHFLEGVTDPDERQECLRLASDAGLNIPVITKHVVENIRNRDWPEFNLNTNDLPHDATTTEFTCCHGVFYWIPEDQCKIDAIDWLVYDRAQRGEAIRQANAIMRTFLVTRKHAAAREVFNKIPTDSLDLIIKSWQLQTGTTTLNPEDDNAIKEYLCIKAYLDAQESFNDWFEYFHNAKPCEPEDVTGSDFTERVYQEHRYKQYKSELERWQHSLNIQTNTTVDQIYNVLLFVDGGWMVDRNKDGIVDSPRQHQMVLNRQLCIPTLVLLLHTVLHSTGRYKDCTRIADIIASEQHQLYTVFNKEELQKLLQKVQESAIANLEENNDPLGYKLL